MFSENIDSAKKEYLTLYDENIRLKIKIIELEEKLSNTKTRMQTYRDSLVETHSNVKKLEQMKEQIVKLTTYA